jgi:Fe-S-cluster containining protein
MDRGSRRRKAKEDAKLAARGLNPASATPVEVGALARHLSYVVAKAKSSGTVDPIVHLLHSRVDDTIRGMRAVPVSCKRGCSYCCNIWVSATALEILSIAKIIRGRGEAAISKVREANSYTVQFHFEFRDQHPYPCPMLSKGECTIYDARPNACRLAASANADICERSFLSAGNENIPTPALYVFSREMYSIALASAIRRNDLPTHAYELNAGLICALDTENAEALWLSGTDIFAEIHRDPVDVFANPAIEAMYANTFAV